MASELSLASRNDTRYMDEDEELLVESKNRYVIYPIKYDSIWKMYKLAMASFWTVEEIDLAKDCDDWHKLSENEQYFIKNILAFFAGSDGIVNENLSSRFMDEVVIPEAKCFYGFQIAIENIHAEAYSLLIDTYIKDQEEKNRLLNAIYTIPCIKKKADWAFKWITSKTDSFAHRLVAFAAVEGIFFSGAFCAIFWLKERGVMPGLTFSNELISRDEGLHTEFAVLLYSMLQNKLTQEDIHSLIKEAVEIEIEFITDSIPCHMLGMNSILMTQYIKYVSDRLIVQLGYDRIYNVQNPFDFMERIGLNLKSNFFEHKSSEYSRANVGGSENKSDTFKFTLDADF
jgi:ribonucleotide reductase beta subunit family protein with ferritin-like domain